MQADPTATSGKADTARRDERRRRPVAAPGYWRQHVHKESARNTGSPKARSEMTNQTPVRERLGAVGWRRGFLVPPLKPGNAGGGKGPQFKTDARRSEGPGDSAAYQLRTAFRNCRRRCTRKRRQNPAIASMPSTTRSAARTFWRRPMPSAAPTRARRAWTVRLRGRRGVRGGAMAGRTDLRSGRSLTDRTLSDAFSYRRPTANSGRWASQPCGIGSA